MEEQHGANKEQDTRKQHSDSWIMKTMTKYSTPIHTWSIFFFLFFTALLLLAVVNRSSIPVFVHHQVTAPLPPFMPLPHYDLTTVKPNEVLSRVPRIRAPEQWITDLSPNCLKHPTNGIDDECWNAFRRHQFLSVLEALYKSPDAELERFKPNYNWQIFGLITPTYRCDANSLKRIGWTGDGGKWLCGPIRVLGPKCVIFSLGSNNQFDFEEAIAKHTNGECEIHTFDCTGQWSHPSTTFHPWCLGGFDGVDDQGRTFKRLSTAAKEVGVASISLLKMDIEHGEYEVFEGFKREPEEFLPDQILFELHTRDYPSKTSKHVQDWPRTIIDLVRDIDAMGYSFAFDERNLECPACVEYVVVRDRPQVLNTTHPT